MSYRFGSDNLPKNIVQSSIDYKDVAYNVSANPYMLALARDTNFQSSTVPSLINASAKDGFLQI